MAKANQAGQHRVGFALGTYLGERHSGQSRALADQDLENMIAGYEARHGAFLEHGGLTLAGLRALCREFPWWTPSLHADRIASLGNDLAWVGSEEEKALFLRLVGRHRPKDLGGRPGGSRHGDDIADGRRILAAAHRLRRKDNGKTLRPYMKDAFERVGKGPPRVEVSKLRKSYTIARKAGFKRPGRAFEQARRRFEILISAKLEKNSR